MVVELVNLSISYQMSCGSLYFLGKVGPSCVKLSNCVCGVVFTVSFIKLFFLCLQSVVANLASFLMLVICDLFFLC